MLFRGRVPLVALGPGFFGRPCDANGFGGVEAQVDIYNFARMCTSFRPVPKGQMFSITV